MLRKGLQVFRDSLRFFREHPLCVLPLMLCWCVYAAVLLYFNYGFDFSPYTTGQTAAILFGAYVLYAFLFGLACLILLELIQQLERGEKASLLKAAYDSVLRDFWKSIPVLLIWAVIWFALVLLEALFSKKKDRNGSELTAKSAVGTLLGADQKLSLSGAFFSALAKGVRMIAFLILPAIAWEDLSPAAAIKKGLRTLRNTKEQFLVAYGLTELFALAVLLPPAIVYKLDDMLALQLPALVWYIILIYMSFATSMIFLVEQLYAAQLYLWHLNWEKVCAACKRAGKIPPAFTGCGQPEFFKRFCTADAKTGVIKGRGKKRR